MGLTYSKDGKTEPQCTAVSDGFFYGSDADERKAEAILKDAACEKKFYEDAARYYIATGLEIEMAKEITFVVFVSVFVGFCICYCLMGNRNSSRGTETGGTTYATPAVQPSTQNFSGVQQPGPYAPSYPPQMGYRPQ